MKFKVINFNNYDIKIKKNNSTYHLGILLNDALIAYLSVIIGSYNQIGRTLVDQNFRKQGWMRCLIDYFTKNIGPLICDNTQTPDAKDMWIALIKMPGNLKISTYNIKTKKKSKIKFNQSGEPSVWNNNPDIVLLAEERIMTEQEINHRLISERNIEWYGVFGNEKYINP